VNRKTIRGTVLAVVAGLTASCAPIGGTGYDANGYPVRNQASGQDIATAAALGIAGLATYGYLKERGNRKDLKREKARHDDYYHNRGYRGGQYRDQRRGRGWGRY
jgi:hypothetical protein